MGLVFGDLTKAPLRQALKRGLARQAVAQAHEADLPAIIGDLLASGNSRKALIRLAERIKARCGVVRVRHSDDGLVLILRNRRQMISRQDAAELFTEDALFYTRVALRADRRRGLHISRASFCLHAVERLVERSQVALDRPLLAALDQEGATILRHAAGARLIEDGDDRYAPAQVAGVWAGRVDLSEPEPDWGLRASSAGVQLPVFSARTFLGPDEMRPTVYLRWKADPALSLG